MSIETLADVPAFTARPSRRVAPQRKAVSWILAGLIQLLIVSLLTVSQLPKVLKLYGAPLIETEITLPGNTPVARPEVRMTAPNAPMVAPPVILTPPPPEFQMERPREDAGTPEGDLLGAVGRDVACLANNYENLTSYQRAHCQRAPWQGVRLPNGLIVLAPAPGNRFVPPPPQFQISGADAQRRAIETAPTCPPSSLNVPCLNVVPGR